MDVYGHQGLLTDLGRLVTGDRSSESGSMAHSAGDRRLRGMGGEITGWSGEQLPSGNGDSDIRNSDRYSKAKIKYMFVSGHPTYPMIFC